MLRPPRPNIVDYEQVSSDEDCDDASSNASTIKNLIDDCEIGIENGEIVELTHIKDYQTVYVRPIKFDVKFEGLMKRLNARAPRAIELPLRANQVVLIKFCGDYARAVIIDPLKITVHLVDFGITKDVPNSDELRYISPELIDEHHMVVAVRLKFANNVSADDETAVFAFLNKCKYNKSHNFTECADLAHINGCFSL